MITSCYTFIRKSPFVCSFFILSLIGYHFPSSAFTQDIVDDVISVNTTIYSNEWAVAFLLNTNGLGIGAHHLIHKNIRTAYASEVFFSGYVHPQQVKTNNPYYEDSESYYFGKLSSFYSFKAGWGIWKTLVQKPLVNGVKLSGTASIGPAIGFEKPTYLQIIQPDANYQSFIVTTERFDPAKHFAENIYGGASWFKGLENTKATLGLYSRLALMMEFGIKNKHVYAFETGINAEYYPSGIAIMAFKPRQYLLVALHIGLWIGKRK
jgi:hypothetical protein